jgi:uncharacterized membrane protein
MKVKTADHVALGAIIVAVALTAVLYPQLPERMPTHFDLHGVADGWMVRRIGAWLLPVLAAGTWLLLRLGGVILPRAWSERFAASPTSMVGALVASLFCALHCVILYAAMAKPPTVAVSLGLVLGGFWALLGLLMPKIRRNPWIGVRTPWTLSSDENWARTHRMAGYAFVAAGLLAVFAVAVGYAIVAPVLLVASAIVPVIYSFLWARRPPRMS